jgi:predicted Zn finger-like uncharacterized protein
MKIVCPSCAATYEVPESAVTSKRAVRCARCGGDWVPGAAESTEPPPSAELSAPPPLPPEPAPEPVMQAAPEPAPPAEEVAAPEPVKAPPAPPTAAAAQWQGVVDAIAHEAASRPPPPVRAKPPVAAWFVSVTLLVILVAAAVAFRAPIMKAWPPSTRLYAALGLYNP